MTNELQMIDNQNLQNKIHTIRGVQVMLDRDLAELYQVETRRLNEQVKRNSERFPEEFMFQLSQEEFENWKSQFATSNDKMGLRKYHMPLLSKVYQCWLLYLKVKLLLI